MFRIYQLAILDGFGVRLRVKHDDRRAELYYSESMENRPEIRAYNSFAIGIMITIVLLDFRI